MPMYFFCFEAEPTSASPQAHDIKAAMVNIFVLADSQVAAESRAREHLLEYAWLAKSVEVALEPKPEQIARLDTALVALHRKALREGVASEFTAWPKVEGKEDDPIEVRVLGAPILDDTKKH